MRFETGSIQSIRSISQKSLAVYWQALADGPELPTLFAFNPSARLHDPRQLSIWERTSEENGPRFRAVQIGENIREAFGPALAAGASMNVAVPSKLLELSLAGSNASVENRCPIYMVISSTDDDGNPLECERLVLPFGDKDEVVALVASLQLVSTKRNPSRRLALSHFLSRADVTLALKVLPG